jgi:hypothetical protein
MALLPVKSGVPSATAPIHHAHHLTTEISMWAPIVALGALTLAAYIVLWLRVSLN